MARAYTSEPAHAILSGDLADDGRVERRCGRLAAGATPVPGTTGASARYARQSARFILEPISVPDLGRFLATWLQHRPQWTITSISITPAPERGATKNDINSSEASPARPVRATLVIECLHAVRNP